ncbi:MAG: antiterminator LoaP [Clostridiales bacterium]|nr:antiterminator LoaP [Clostridiales bacterium]
MWYVTQVFTGEEEKIRQLCAKQISTDILEKCFVPYSEQMKRYRGSWHKEHNILFPGYVFMITDSVEILWDALKDIPGFTRILGNPEHLLLLTDSEVAFLRRFGGEDQLVEMFIGLIQNDSVRIMEGPLIGFEGCIKKIDRHKRLAKIEIEMFGQLVETTVGLKVVRKLQK